MRLVSLLEMIPENFPFPSSHMKAKPEDGCQGSQRALTRYQPCWHLNLGVLVFMIVRKYISVVEDIQLMVLCYGRPSCLRHLPHTSYHFHKEFQPPFSPKMTFSETSRSKWYSNWLWKKFKVLHLVKQ